MWSPLTQDDALALFSASERDIVAADSELVSSICGDITARIREACLANSANILGEGVPRSYRQDALALVRRALLLRYDLPISDDRRAAADKAEERIAALADKKLKVMTDQGLLPSVPTNRPQITTRETVYNVGRGLYPRH